MKKSKKKHQKAIKTTTTVETTRNKLEIKETSTKCINNHKTHEKTTNTH